MSDPRIVMYAAAGFGFGLYIFYSAFGWRKQQLLIEAIPTSKVRSIAMGDVEVAGQAHCAKEELIAPFSGTTCTYFRITIEEYVSRGKSKYWKTVHEKTSDSPFHLKDETGQVLVDPRGAEIDLPMSMEFSSSFGKDPAKRIMDYLTKNKMSFEGLFGANKSMRYREYLIQEGQQIYVLGYAGKRPGAKGSVRNEDTIMIQKGSAAYIISSKSEHEVVSGLKWKVFGGWFGGAALAIVCLFIIFAFFGIL